MQRPLWPVILIAIFGYKLGEAMAGVMSTPLYIALGFSLPEIDGRHALHARNWALGTSSLSVVCIRWKKIRSE